MPRCAKAPVVCWRRGSGEVGRTVVEENVLVVGEEGRKTESSPQVREVSGRSTGEFWKCKNFEREKAGFIIWELLLRLDEDVSGDKPT